MARGLHKIRARITQDTHADLPPIKYLNPRRGFGGIPREGGSGVSPDKLKRKKESPHDLPLIYLWVEEF